MRRHALRHLRATCGTLGRDEAGLRGPTKVAKAAGLQLKLSLLLPATSAKCGPESIEPKHKSQNRRTSSKKGPGSQQRNEAARRHVCTSPPLHFHLAH